MLVIVTSMFGADTTSEYVGKYHDLFYKTHLYNSLHCPVLMRQVNMLVNKTSTMTLTSVTKRKPLVIVRGLSSADSTSYFSNYKDLLIKLTSIANYKPLVMVRLSCADPAGELVLPSTVLWPEVKGILVVLALEDPCLRLRKLQAVQGYCERRCWTDTSPGHATHHGGV